MEGSPQKGSLEVRVKFIGKTQKKKPSSGRAENLYCEEKNSAYKWKKKWGEPRQDIGQKELGGGEKTVLKSSLCRLSVIEKTDYRE